MIGPRINFSIRYSVLEFLFGLIRLCIYSFQIVHYMVVGNRFDAIAIRKHYCANNNI